MTPASLAAVAALRRSTLPAMKPSDRKVAAPRSISARWAAFGLLSTCSSFTNAFSDRKRTATGCLYVNPRSCSSRWAIGAILGSQRWGQNDLALRANDATGIANATNITTTTNVAVAREGPAPLSGGDDGGGGAAGRGGRGARG